MNRCDGCDYEFGPFHIDREKRLLLRDGKPVSLVPKSFDMLLALVQHRGEVLEKDRLLNMLWPDSIVEEANLPQNISALRKALGEGPSERRYIETVPRRGYRFLASVREVRNEGPELIEHDPAESGAVLAKDELKQPPPANTIRVNRWFWPAAVLALALGFAVWFGLFRTSPRSSLPLVRTFPVTSFPGQEKWPAFSPDGNQIAFAWEGERRDNFDIYVKLIGTGEPLRLTQHPGLDVCPAWSPDGQTIAFIRAYQGQVNLLSVPALGGAERTLIPLNFKGDWYGQYPTLSWSPDGKLIAFPDRQPGKNGKRHPSVIGRKSRESATDYPTGRLLRRFVPCVFARRQKLGLYAIRQRRRRRCVRRFRRRWSAQAADVGSEAGPRSCLDAGWEEHRIFLDSRRQSPDVENCPRGRYT